jgi:adenylate cyclase
MATGLSLRVDRLARGMSRRLAYVLPFLVLLGAAALRMADPPSLQQLRNYAFDSFQRFSPRPWAPDILPVRIVDIDESSLRDGGQWPWPRTRIAEMVDRLTEAQAAVIGFDVFFSEPDRTSPRRVLATIANQLDPETLLRLEQAAGDNDRVLADAIAKSGRVVIAFGLDRDGAPVPPRRIHGGVPYAGDDPKLFLRPPEGTIRNIEIIEEAAAGNGSVMTDIADVIRYVPLMFRVPHDEHPFPALSIETLRVLQGAGGYTIKSSNASDTKAFGVTSGITHIRVGEIEVPTQKDGSIVLFDTGHKPQRFVSALDVLKRRVDPEKLAGHIVLIGSSAAGLKDLRNTPIESAVAGVEVHAQIIEQMLLLWQGAKLAAVDGAPAILKQMAERFMLLRPDYASGTEIIYLVVVGLLVLFLLPRLRARWMLIFGMAAIAAGLLVPWLLYRYEGLLFDPIYPSGTVAAMYILGSAFSFIQAEMERAQIRGAFSMYLTPTLVEQLARNPDKLQLGGETREITVMFTDVRGFTTISEGFDAQQLTRFMNRVLTPMTDIILASHGTIDKYMGDAIMAFWNAPLDEPDHARRACGAALRMQARLKELNVEWKAEDEREGRRFVEVHIGVGLNGGPASVGNFGSTQRFSYSVMGDDVNLASRLEGQCKTYAVDVVIGEKTRQKAEDFAAVEIDLIMVKGKTTPERVFALIGDPQMAGADGYRALITAQARMLDAYRAGDFAGAAKLSADAEQAAEAIGWRAGYYAMMRGRCAHLIEEPPEDWNGVFVAKEK